MVAIGMIFLPGKISCQVKFSTDPWPQEFLSIEICSFSLKPFCKALGLQCKCMLFPPISEHLKAVYFMFLDGRDLEANSVKGR